MSHDTSDQYPISIGFTATDVTKSIAFYRDQLGFTVKECWPDEKNPLHASLLLDKQTVMFGKVMPASEIEKFCAGDPTAAGFWNERTAAFQKSAHGAGVNLYLLVPDIDAFAAAIQKKGVKLALAPKTQFYGMRTAVVVDPDGYTLTFYSPVKMESCQSCGMPLADATPGQMYCQYCTDEKGKLKPYEQVFEGTVRGYFMEHMKMARPEAEVAARAHLAKLPAWAARA